MGSFYWSGESPFVLSHSSYIKGAKTVGPQVVILYEGWNFYSSNYLFTTDTK